MDLKIQITFKRCFEKEDIDLSARVSLAHVWQKEIPISRVISAAHFQK